MKKSRWLIVSGLLAIVCTPVFPADYGEVVNSGIILLEQGMAEEAIKVFESARRIQPSSPEAYYYLGKAYYSRGKRTEALENYSKAVELQGSNPDYHYSIALLYLSEGKTEDAVARLNKVIEIAPLSIAGKYAVRLKQAINADRGNSEMVQKWSRIEEERRKQLELEQQQKEQTTQTPEGVPPEFIGMMPEGQQKPEEIVKLPVEQIIKRIRFGTGTVRLRSSSVLRLYEQAELAKVSTDITELIQLIKEQPPVRKNLINSLGKAALPEGITTILGIIRNKDELYDIKIVCLESISKIKTQEVSGVLKSMLKEMVDKRVAERAAAKKNIDEITSKLDSLAARKIKLNNDVNQEEQKRNEINQKLDVTQYDMPPDMMPGGLTVSGAQKPLTSEKEIIKLRAEVRKIEASIQAKKEEIAKTDTESTELEKQKARYVALLEAKEKKVTDITMPIAMQSAEPVPGEMIMPGMEPQQQYAYQETDEDKNEVVFALQAMRAIGDIRDKDGLPAVKRGWDEYGIENERIYYLLTLARLGDYTGIKNLADRLKDDYPQDIATEVRLRTGIIEVIGEYIAKKPDGQMLGLIEFLSEEGAYPEIKGVASSVLRALAKPAPERKKPEAVD